jgi:hypothetical protein
VHRGQKHLLTRWRRKQRRLEEVLAEARRREEAEQEAARARLLA